MKLALVISLVFFLMADTPYSLTDQERGQWQQFSEQEKALSQQYEQSIAFAVGTPVGDRSRDIHGAIQQSWLSLNLIRARRDGFLAQLRADHGCKTCMVEGGKLMPPPGK